MGVESYSTTPGSNTALFPENQSPSTVNNGARQLQADIAETNQDPGWYRPGAPAYTTSYLTPTSFRVAGIDVSAIYHAGRRVRAVGASTGTIYGSIASAAYQGGNTDVTVTWSSGALTSESLTIAVTRVGGAGTAQSLPFASSSISGTSRLASAAEWIAGTATGAVVPSIAAIVAGGAFDDTTYWRLTFTLPGNIRIEWGAAPANTVRSYLAPFVAGRAALFVTPSHGTAVRYFATVTNETPSGFTPVVNDAAGNSVGIPVTYMAAGVLA